ncbi:MAG TPA: cold shock domain-containing protein [Stellaceae bacterium]|nr:cold shock domain-containing protein [Stellaceae bacterium]
MSTFQPAGETFRLSGKVKWFNRSKGFGFIVPSDGGGDIFLPAAVLERAGLSEAPDGASVIFDWSQGPKGRAVAHIVELDASTAAPRAPRENRPRHRDGQDTYRDGQETGGATESLDGVVKWYDPARGFGFVLPNDGGKDIFVHVTALRRAGIEMLEPGQPVRMTVAQARRGREAASIELK